MNKKSKLVIAIVMASLSGCAAQQTVTGSKAGDGALLGSGVGAAVGSLIAQTTGLPVGAGALIGGALGAGTGYYIGHNQDLAIAEENAKKWNSAGFQTTTYAAPAVQAQQVQMQAQPGQSGMGGQPAQQEQRLDRVEIEIPAKMLKARSSALDALLLDAGKMSVDSKYRYIYKVHAKTEKDANYLLSKIRSGAAPKDIISSWIKSNKAELIMEVIPA